MTSEEIMIIEKSPLLICHSIEQAADWASILLKRKVTLEEYKEYFYGEKKDDSSESESN